MDKRLCRDCADFGPICPNSGQPCGGTTASQARPTEFTEIPTIDDYRPPRDCPFCGMNAICLEGFHMTCIRCGADGPDADDDTAAAAIAKWNRRADASPAQNIVADLLDHINALSEQLGDAAPDPRALMTKVNGWLEQRERTPDERILAARAEGRGEALELILRTDAEEALSQFTREGPSNDTGERSCHWDTKKLREFLLADDRASDMIGRFEEMYWDRRGLRMEAADLVRRLRAALARADEQVQAPPAGREVERTAPARIYLNVSDSAEHFDMPFPKDPHGDDITWSEDKALDCCVEYVRAGANHPEIPESSPAVAEPLPEGVVISAYRFNDHMTVQRMSQIDGPDLWAVRNRFSEVLNVHGDWEWEPMPSSRDEGFLARCRYLSSGAAIAAAQQREAADRNNPKE